MPKSAIADLGGGSPESITPVFPTIATGAMDSGQPLRGFRNDRCEFCLATIGKRAVDEPSVHPVACRLRPCRQFRRGISAAADRRRSVADPHRAILQSHRLWRMARPAV